MRNPAKPTAVADAALPFALAVAARQDAIRVYPHPPINETVQVRWDGRTLPSLPYAIYLHDIAGCAPTLALEFDGAHGDPGIEAAGLAGRLRATGFECVLCASGRPGHRHLFAAVRPPLAPQAVRELLDRLRTLAPSLDPSPMLNARTGAIRPPLAPHRLGGCSALVDPTNAEEALAILRRPNPTALLKQATATIPSPGRSHVNLRGGLTILERPLSEATAYLLREGDTARSYRSRSDAEAALVLGLVNAGWPPERIQAVAEDPVNLGFPKYREKLARSIQDAQRYLERTITWAITTASANPPIAGQIQEELRRLAEEALIWHPGGRTAAVDRIVLLAHVRAALAARSREHGLSVRQCAEWAGVVDHHTVTRARRRLARTGWLAPAGDERLAGAAQLFSLLGGRRGGEKSPHSLPRGRGGMGLRLLTPDVFRAGALGPGAGEVHALLVESGHEWTVTAIGATLGHDRKTVRRHLRALSQLRLALCSPVGWLASARAPEDALNELPAHLRTLGERQREQHARERRHWAACRLESATRRALADRRSGVGTAS